MRLTILYMVSIVLLASGCFKEEQPITRKDRGSMVSGKVEMGNSYRNQVYFNLQSNANVQVVDKFSWDIALSGNPDHPFIELNTSKSMSANLTANEQLVEIKDTIGYFNTRLYDYPSGFSDSLALSGILENKKVYLLDLGHDENSQKAGLLLLKAKVFNGHYVLEFSDIDGSHYQIDTVAFDNTVKSIFYHFKTKTISKEPPQNSWDFLFTQYMHIYYDPFQTYSVTGCMINQDHITAGVYSGQKLFNEITIGDTLNTSFSSRKNIIGFDWKYFDLPKNQYYVNDKKCYFIKHKLGKYYKLHFIDFYNSSGVKGTPVFEFQEL